MRLKHVLGWADNDSLSNKKEYLGLFDDRISDEISDDVIAQSRAHVEYYVLKFIQILKLNPDYEPLLIDKCYRHLTYLLDYEIYEESYLKDKINDYLIHYVLTNYFEDVHESYKYFLKKHVSMYLNHLPKSFRVNHFDELINISGSVLFESIKVWDLAYDNIMPMLMVNTKFMVLKYYHYLNKHIPTDQLFDDFDALDTLDSRATFKINHEIETSELLKDLFDLVEDPIDKEILNQYITHDKTLKEVADFLGVSTMTISRRYRSLITFFRDSAAKLLA
jgi:hypothetical protein